MKEAMRLHPGVSYPLERLVPEGGVNLCGQKLREGTNVGINPVVVHQNRAIFGMMQRSFDLSGGWRPVQNN